MLALQSFLDNGVACLTGGDCENLYLGLTLSCKTKPSDVGRANQFLVSHFVSAQSLDNGMFPTWRHSLETNLRAALAHLGFDLSAVEMGIK